MTLHPRRAPIAFFLLGFSFALLGACGGGDDAGAPPPPVPTPDAGPDTSPPPPAPPPPPLVCKPKTADCDGVRSNGCEVDLDHDAANCGACGVSCGKAACNAGTCDPETLATNLPGVSALAADETSAYVAGGTSNASVLRVAYDGSAPTELFAPAPGYASSLTLAGDQLVLLAGNTIFTGPREGVDVATRSFPVAGYYAPLAVVGDTAYLFAQPTVFGSSAPSGDVLGRPLHDGATVNLASGVGKVVALVPHGDAVYAAIQGTGTIVRFPVDGSPATTLVSGVSDLAALVVDDARVYWLTQPAQGDGDLASAPIGGGAHTLLAHVAHGVALAQSGAALYYLADDPSSDDAGVSRVRHLYGVRKTGGAARVVATLGDGNIAPTVLAATNDHVVFARTDVAATGFATSTLLRVPAVDGGSGPALTQPPAACDATHADCNHDPSDGCETSLDSDAAHCGACGHSCLGGVCSAGACGETVIIAYHDTDAFDATGWVVNDDTNLYWTSTGAVNVPGRYLFRRAITGGPIAEVASLPAKGDLYAIDAERVYFLQDGLTVESMAKTGGPLAFIGTANDKANFYPKVIVRGGFVYWMTDAHVWRAPIAGGAPPTAVLTPSYKLNDFDVDDTSIYAAAGGIYAGPLDGSAAPRLLVPNPSDVGATAVHVDASGLTFGWYDGTLNSADKTGGSIASIAKFSSLYPWYPVVTTDAAVYVAVSDPKTPYQRYAKSHPSGSSDTTTYGASFVVTPQAFASSSYGVHVLAR